jgi:hypothetical protein
MLPLMNEVGEQEEIGNDKETSKKVELLSLGSQVQTADIELNGMLEPFLSYVGEPKKQRK